jgi:hypothetical protein
MSYVMTENIFTAIHGYKWHIKWYIVGQIDNLIYI